MKRLLTLALFFLVSLSGFGQVTKTSGIIYSNGSQTIEPDSVGMGINRNSELNFDYQNKILTNWNRNTRTWDTTNLSVVRQEISESLKGEPGHLAMFSSVDSSLISTTSPALFFPNIASPGLVFSNTATRSTISSAFTANAGNITSLNSGGTVGFSSVRVSNNGSPTAISLVKSRGTAASPTAENSGTQIGDYNWSVYNGSSVVSVARIRGYTNTRSASSPYNYGSKLEFFVGDTSNVNNISGIVLDGPSKNMGIFESSPTALVHVSTTSIGTSPTMAKSLLLVNNTAASAGAQQMSPSLMFRGNGWKTNATAASQTVDFKVDVLPVQGATNPTGYLSFSASINGAAYNESARFGNNYFKLIGTANQASGFYYSSASIHAVRTFDNSTILEIVNGVDDSWVNLRVRAKSAQTALLQSWENSSGTSLSVVDVSGNMAVGSATVNASTRFHVKGSGTTSATSTALFESSDGTDNLEVKDDGSVLLGTNRTATTQTTSSINAAGSGTNIGVAIVPKGTGAFTLQIPDGTVTGGNARGSGAVDLQSVRIGAAQVASGAYSFLVGVYGTASGTSSICLSQDGATASGNYSAAFGSSLSASALYSYATGTRSSAYLYGQESRANGFFGSNGDAQSSKLILRKAITGTAISELFLDGASIQAILPSTNKIWNAKVQVVAVCTATGNGTTAVGASWTGNYEVGIKRIGSSTSLVGGGVVTSSTAEDATMVGAVTTITADDVNEALKIEWTPPGTAGSTSTYRVVATIYLTEVGY